MINLLKMEDQNMSTNTNESMEKSSARRDFLMKAATVVSATSLAAGAATSAHAAQKESSGKLKLGVFGLDYTFWGLWADILSPKGRWSAGNFFNMEPAYVWDKDMKKAREFADKWGCEVVEKYDGMLGKVDGVVNGELYNIPWQHKLFRPYIEAGVPAYLQRPWSTRLRDLDEMLNLAAKHGTPIIATATYEHYNEADNFQQKLKNVGEIKAAYATCGAGDRPHFHIPYMMMKILGYNVDTISLITSDPKGRSGGKPFYLCANYVYGESNNQPPYVLSMHGSSTDVFNFKITGRDGTEEAVMPGGSSYFYRFATQLMDIQKTIETKTNYQPLDIVRKKFECVLTEYYSHYERGGAPVKVGTVPPDWQLPPYRPNWYNDSDF